MKMGTPRWAREGNELAAEFACPSQFPWHVQHIRIFWERTTSVTEYVGKKQRQWELWPWTWSSPAPLNSKLGAVRREETWAGAELRALDCRSKASLFTFGKFLERRIRPRAGTHLTHHICILPNTYRSTLDISVHNNSLLDYSIINNTREKSLPFKTQTREITCQTRKDGWNKKTVTSVGKDTEKLEALYVASEIVKWYSHFEKTYKNR